MWKLLNNFKILIILIFGLCWIVANIFYLPFSVWTGGLYTPWLILQGLTPYKDFVWIRTPLDIYLLSAVYRIFGLSEVIYQLTILILYLLIALTIFVFLHRKSLLLGLVSFICYVILLFPLFINTEIGEILLSLFVVAGFFCFCVYIERKKLFWLFAAGLALGLGLITKHTSALLVLTLPFLVFAEGVLIKTSWKRLVLSIGILVIGLAIPVTILIIYLVTRGALSDFLYYSVFFNFKHYGVWARPWGINDALMMMGLYVSIISPLLILRNIKILNMQERVYLICFILLLFPSHLPSFWSYRLITAFPLLSVAIAVVLIEVASAFKKRHKLSIFVCAVSILASTFFFNHYFKLYLGFIKDNGFSSGQYIKDYTENEIRAGDWISKNTSKNEKIFNMSNNMIMLRSDRLPANKYIDAIPIVYYPLTDSFTTIVNNLPKFVIYDESVSDNRLVDNEWKYLHKNWQFFDYLRKNYSLIQQFEYIKIYRFTAQI